MLRESLTRLSTDWSQCLELGADLPGFRGSYKNAGIMSMYHVADNTEHWIEFIGGPFDGHWQRCHWPVKRLPADIVWLVCEDAFRQIDWPRQKTPSLGGALSSAALYELDDSAAMPTYRHAGSISAHSFGDAIRNVD